MTFLLFIGEMFRAAKKHWRIAVPVALLVIVALFAIISRACWTNHEINKTQDAVTETRIEEANKDAVSQTANVAVEQANRKAQAASNERQQAIKRDSNQYQNTNAGERFCERFPEDSSCHR